MMSESQTARNVSSAVEKATNAWGEDMPAWVRALAEACQSSTQKAVAKRLDYSGAAVSLVLSNTYTGDLARFEVMVRTHLLAETLSCPALGDIPRTQCLEWQDKPLAMTSSFRVLMYRACRNSCPFSRISGSKSSGENA